MNLPSPLDLTVFSVLTFFAIAILAPVFASRQKVLINISFSLSALACVAAIAGGYACVDGAVTEAVVIPVGLPDLPFYMRLDPLSGFFVTVTALLGLFVSIYSIGYMRGFLGHRPVTSLVVFYSLFMAGMLLVLLSDDAYFFMISWELMAASSFFLVLFEGEYAKNRRAAFLYLLVAHIGAVLILLSFGVLAGFSSAGDYFSGYTFSAMRNAHLSAGWAAFAFLFAFFGFAAKAGVVPLHVWLPEAHPVAPSNISALMSGVMLKTAIYGIIRLVFDLLHASTWWWGGLVLVFGLISAVLGILYALMQNDFKKLLAYSSVENIGIILVCIGLAMIFRSYDMGILAALALMAGLYHVLNHAMFKGLLFMGAGAVLHATHERNIDNLGGLIHKMPWTAPLVLVGCLSISALPPFNGFVSEWLAFQAFLLSPVLPNQLLNLLIPLGAALLALTGTLAARCFLKVYGVTFLGQWRKPHHTPVHEVNIPMRAGMVLAAAACLLTGVLPSFVIGWMDIVPETLAGARIATSAKAFGWLWLTPVAAERASYSAPIVFIGILLVVAVVYAIFRAKKTVIHRGPAWDCGFAKMNNRMQYNSLSFAMPLRKIFGSVFNIKETLKPSGDPNVYPAFHGRYTYHLKIRDRIWSMFYRPFSDASFWLSRRVGKLQHGRIQIYLLYSFVTLILLLVFA